MDVNERTRFVRSLPERIELGGIEGRADAARQRPDHGAREARRDSVLEHGGRALAVAQWHGRQRHEMRLGF